VNPTLLVLIPLLPLAIGACASLEIALRREIPLRSLGLRLLSTRSGATILPFLTCGLAIFLGSLTILTSRLTVLFVPLLCEGGGCNHRRREQEGE